MRNAGCWMMLIVVALAGRLDAGERTEQFDREPGWEGFNNRSENQSPRTIEQNFGFSKTAHAGGEPGEIGGLITPAAEPAFYAKKIPAKSFADVLTASGTLACPGRPFHVLICFFNADTINEWRTPNTIAVRLSGRGDVFYAWVEYATNRWRAGGDSPQSFPTELDPATGRQQLKGFAAGGKNHRWSLTYEPRGGGGVVTAEIDGKTAICNLSEGHRADGALFNRFGLLNVSKSADTGGELWLDDVEVNGKADHFDVDPGWEGFQNRRTFVSTNVRPRFDFGFSPTQFAGGKSRGELGGLLFRGDCRYAERMASYGDRLEELTLNKPIHASGKVCLRRGVSDSSVLVGFYHSTDSMTVNPSQQFGLPQNFLGISTDGPSSEGFYFAPTYRTQGDKQAHASEKPPRIHPDGKSHDWSFEYAPVEANAGGQISVTLDNQSVRLEVKPEHRAAGSRFNRFGLITTWIDGNGQQIYFDDLTYTASQGN